MILYHGTDSKNLNGILDKGLLPRKFTGQQVYQNDLASNEDFTYLTRWNPVAHAYSIDENKPVILKVDIDESELYPDEDFIERMLSWDSLVKGKGARDINPAEIDITQHKDMWKRSYDLFGNVAIKQVPPEKIIAHAILDPSDFEYHCGMGAQGNQMHSDLKNVLHFADPNRVKKYIERLEILFTEGWDTVKRDILKERPSLTLSLQKPTEQIRVKGIKVRVLFEPNPAAGLAAYICDEWQENFPIHFPMIDKRFSKLLQLPANFTNFTNFGR